MLWILLVIGSILLQPCTCQNDSRHHLAFAARDGKGWGSDTTTFFDIALTALAFLSFGIFLLNLLLNALMFPAAAAPTNLTNPGPILTMLTGEPTGGAIVTSYGLVGRSRNRRAIFSPEVDFITSSTLLVNFVTNSIETMAQKHECIPRKFCEGNRQARVLGKGFQYLFPLLSVSISYIGKLLGLHDDVPKHLQAILMGVSEANCQLQFDMPTCKKR